MLRPQHLLQEFGFHIFLMIPESVRVKTKPTLEDVTMNSGELGPNID